MLVINIFHCSIAGLSDACGGVSAFWIIREMTRDVIVNVVVIDEEEEP